MRNMRNVNTQQFILSKRHGENVKYEHGSVTFKFWNKTCGRNGEKMACLGRVIA